MNLFLYFTFFYFLFFVGYYFIYQEKMNYDNLFTILLNIIFLVILPLYHFYFKDSFLSLIIGISLFISAFCFNLRIKEAYHTNKIPPLLYFLFTAVILGYLIEMFLKF